jgi:hypothetical protein
VQAQEELQESVRGARHLHVLAELDPPEGDRAFDGELRFCHHCGRRTRFQIDLRGVWYQCLRCGNYD